MFYLRELVCVLELILSAGHWFYLIWSEQLADIRFGLFGSSKYISSEYKRLLAITVDFVGLFFTPKDKIFQRPQSRIYISLSGTQPNSFYSSLGGIKNTRIYLP